jgi:hypothetical protein
MYNSENLSPNPVNTESREGEGQGGIEKGRECGKLLRGSGSSVSERMKGKRVTSEERGKEWRGKEG